MNEQENTQLVQRRDAEGFAEKPLRYHRISFSPE